jgi:putative ABC transport system ATP-binding protein/macrolide transport system ATP-binding/permease protein/lipoprotein-releasing system ATP-binding protein
MMISLQQLSKHYSSERTVSAVDNVSFNFDRGGFLAIVGRSGSGKSTLLGMLGGISKPSSGSVNLDGTDLFSLSPSDRADFRNRNIGFVFQFSSLLPSLRSIDNVALPALIGGTLGDKEAYARARMLLQRVGLSERVDFYPGQLSGGEQRRVAIARALINMPSLLLADEPTADLDEETEKEILDLLVDIHRGFNLTLVVVTHNREIADKADQVLEMRSGHATELPMVRQNAAVADLLREAVGAAAVASSAKIASSSRRPDVPPLSVAVGDGESAARVKNIFEISKQTSAAEKVKLGSGFERLVGRCALWMIGVFGMFWILNAAVGTYENNIIQAKADQRAALEELAMSNLRAEVKDITFGPGKTYLLSLYLRNTNDAQPLYVMTPTVRSFVQVGTSWQEISLKPAESSSPRVVKIEGERLYQYIMEPDVANFTQLLPYYMHVRITNQMLVSPRSEPKDDLIDRSDSYYVYLKPHDAVDAAIEKKMKFPGTPPVWIPMPPH